MHIVTKILIVFGAVLSILLAALTIAMAANVNAIRGSFKAEQSAKIAALADLSQARAQQSGEMADLQKARTAAEAELAKVTDEIKQLQAERATLIAKESEARLAAESIKNQIAGFGDTAKVNAALIKSLTDEVAALRKAQLDSAKRETDLIDRLNDVESQRQVLEQTTRALQEQLSEARLALEAAKSGATTAVAGSPAESLGPRISARIVKLDKFPSGDDLVEINVGSAAGIRENQKLNVVRGGQFIGSLVITTVDLQRSVGRLDRLGRKVEPAVDDLVLSRLD